MFHEIDPHSGVGRRRQPGKGGDAPHRVGPFDMRGQRRGLGQDQRRGPALGQDGPGVHAFRLGGMIPVVGKARPVDHLRLDLRRFAHRAQGGPDQGRQVRADKAVADKQHIAKQGKQGHGHLFAGLVTA